MNKNKLIKFLAFIGIENIELTNQIQNTNYNLTDVILNMASEKINESTETINQWYTNFKY